MRASRCRARPRRPGPCGMHPLQVSGQPAAGDVAERARPGLGGQREAVLGVDPGGLEQLLAECAAELLDVAVPAASGRSPAAPGGPASSRWSAGPVDAIAIEHVAWLDPLRAAARRRPRPRRPRWPRCRSSSGAIRPGCSAVSPPSSAQPAMHGSPRRCPRPIAATRSGTTSPTAM